MKWNGMEWNGNGKEWNGMEWNGMKREFVFLLLLIKESGRCANAQNFNFPLSPFVVLLFF